MYLSRRQTQPDRKKLPTHLLLATHSLSPFGFCVCLSLSLVVSQSPQYSLYQAIWASENPLDKAPRTHTHMLRNLQYNEMNNTIASIEKKRKTQRKLVNQFTIIIFNKKNRNSRASDTCTSEMLSRKLDSYAHLMQLQLVVWGNRCRSLIYILNNIIPMRCEAEYRPRTQSILLYTNNEVRCLLNTWNKLVYVCQCSYQRTQNRVILI